ncbi:hypothetical protein [Actinomadura rubrisoli]|uniref:Terminase large subunit n=1 Tax=Actinomadura rubrisoli TaxID=2530368 RepID=A0A4R5B6G2_9ACTN|nr:hypothetical protein [Actinomadura rubrisoli]TDD80915.1 hypothetical protein E1298_25000 [Actinomadura rubrisoli]
MIPTLDGVAEPRICTVPKFATSAGQECIDLAAKAGLCLDPWQRWVLDRALDEQGDGRWAAFEVGLLVPRQNGKSAIFEARVLAGPSSTRNCSSTAPTSSRPARRSSAGSWRYMSRCEAGASIGSARRRGCLMDLGIRAGGVMAGTVLRHELTDPHGGWL